MAYFVMEEGKLLDIVINPDEDADLIRQGLEDKHRAERDERLWRCGLQARYHVSLSKKERRALMREMRKRDRERELTTI
jgi:hypothetical protein